MIPKINISKLIISIAICQSAGIIGSIFTISAIPTWYSFLNKPSFSPPNWIFGPVWTLLYTLMGISLYLIWQKGIEKKEVKRAINFFGIHLVVNALWSIIFFGLRNPLMGLVFIIILWALIIVVIDRFQRIDKRAAVLLLPYFAWVSFATVLNYTIWQLNKF